MTSLPHPAPAHTAPPEKGAPGEPALVAAARARLAAVTAGLDEGHPAAGELDVAVVVADLDVAAFVGGVADFTLALPRDLHDGWYRTFTRTLFLAGRPANAVAQHRYRHLAPGGDLAWYGPAGRDELRPLSRLLRAFRGAAPVRVPDEPLAVALTGPATRHTAHAVLAIGAVSTAEYLVHVHHLVAEAALRGLLRPGDTLRVEHRPALAAEDFRDALDPANADSVQTRIAPDSTESTVLRLYGALISNGP